jgi:cytochrome c oxidase subunit 4
MRKEYRRCLAVWLALLVLLGLSFGSAWLPMGTWNSAINLGIAVAKIGLVAVFFMHLGRSGGLIRIVAAAALFTLALLFLISGTDYATRKIFPAPWQAPVALPAY